MKFDVRSTTMGKCQNCGSKGLLLSVPVLKSETVQYLENPPDLLQPTFDIKRYCLGCVEGCSDEKESAELATQIRNPKTGEGIELDETGKRYRKIDDSILGAEIVE